MSRRTRFALPAAVLAAMLAAPAAGQAHTTISALQPQGPLLTGARGAYVVRAPNEKAEQNTFKVIMHVPTALQGSISVRATPGWRIGLTRVKTGAQTEEGSPVYKTTAVSWTARTKAEEVAPGEYGQFDVRFQNPAQAGSACVGFQQYYRSEAGSRTNHERVDWTGNPTSDNPKSCLAFVAGA